jgi:hypothetical protein
MWQTVIADFRANDVECAKLFVNRKMLQAFVSDLGACEALGIEQLESLQLSEWSQLRETLIRNGRQTEIEFTKSTHFRQCHQTIVLEWVTVDIKYFEIGQVA